MKKFLAFVLILVATVSVNAEENVEYVLQVLEPTGGKIKRPASWYFEERHRSLNSLAWVISKENAEQGEYETGLSIQFMMGAQKSMNLPLSKIMKNTLESTAKAGRELSRCEPESIGFFTRQCLEVEEVQSRDGGDVTFRVQYSFFWNEEMDMAAITVAGAPINRWDENREIFKTMSEVDLIDLNRFKK